MGRGTRKENGETWRRCQEPRCSPPPFADVPPPAHSRPWSWAPRSFPRRRAWHSVALAAAVWSICQVEAPLHHSLSLTQMGWRLLLVGVLGIGLASAVVALTLCPGLWGRQWVSEQLTRTDTVNQCTAGKYSWVSSETTTPARRVPLSHALTDSLLLCLLQEPLVEPSLPHIQALHCRLEAVCQALERADVPSKRETWPEGGDDEEGDPLLTDKVKHVRSYLQTRTRSLRRLHQVQGGLESRLKSLLEDLEGQWAQLEELHTRATLTKHADPKGPRQGDLDSVRRDTQCASTVLDGYRSRLQECQQRHTDSTRLLQELSWSHSHAVSQSLHGSMESVWPEMLLQWNIEQFDTVQQSFLSLEQQTTTFQAHLGGLSRTQDMGSGKGPSTHTGPLGSCSCSASISAPCSCQCRQSPAVPPGHLTPSPSPTSSRLLAPVPDTETPLTLCERSALQLSTAIGRLGKSGQRK